MSDLDREAGVRRERAGVSDLVARQWLPGLDEPAGRDLLPAAAAKTVEGEERRLLREVGVTPRVAEEASVGLGPLEVGDDVILEAPRASEG